MKLISLTLVLFWLLGSIAQAQLQNNYFQYEETRLRDISLKGSSISILALNGFGFEISKVSDKFVYKGFSLALSSDSVYKMNIFTDFKLGKELINGWTPYLTMGINYSAKYDTSNSIEYETFQENLNYNFHDEKVLLNYGVGINKLVGEKYLIGLEYSKHRLLVIKLGYNF